MDIDELNPHQQLIDVVTAALKDTDIDLELSAPIQASGKKKDGGQYRSFKMTGDETFVFKGLREGKRSSYIFEFEPVDVREYSQIEFGEESVFKVFPALLEPALAALKLDKPASTWNEGTARFRTTLKRQANKERKEAEKADAKETENHYQNDPLWGAWG